MSLCPNCTYQEVENKAGGSVKSYIKLTECSTCETERLAAATDAATKDPYLNPDVVQIKKDIKTAFAGSLGALGGVYAVIESYIEGRDWAGLNTCLADLVTETAITAGNVTTLKGVLNNATHNIDLDNIPEGV